MSKASEILGHAPAEPARRGAQATKKREESSRSADEPGGKRSAVPRRTADANVQRKQQRMEQSSVTGKAALQPAGGGASRKKAKTAQKDRAAAQTLRMLLSHALIILALMYLVLFVIDRINNAMEFINNDLTKALLAVMSILAVVHAEISLYSGGKKGK